MQRTIDTAVIILYMLAAISGGLGGCAVTAHQFIREDGMGKTQMRISWIMAYAVIGAVFGVLFSVYGLFLIDYKNPTDIIGPAMLAGIIGSGTLGGVNTSARFILKRLGVEIVVDVRRSKKEEYKP